MRKFLALLGFAGLLAFAMPHSSVEAASFAPAATKSAAKSNIIKVHRRWRRHRRWRPHVRIYIPRRRYYDYYDDYRPCRWLRRKALRTGRRYWWRRYNRCRWG